MELQFQKSQLPYLQTLLRNQQTQEQTQEVRISDGMPDIGSILGSWGQVILRGKEWSGDTLTVTGGTMVWVQYIPEEGGAPKTVEAWIPFQMRWNIPATDHDGVMLTQCQLKSVDGRCTSARKMMLRTNISVLLHAMQRCYGDLYQPVDIPEDVQLHRVTYPVLLPAEAGEKAFTLEESFQVNAPEVTAITAAHLQPGISENRMMGDKLIFRGTGQLRVLCESADGLLNAMDFDLSFSQYSELDQGYDEDAQILLWPEITALEVEISGDQLRVRAGIAVQYMIRHRPLIEIIDDAYSNCRSTELRYEELSLPGILESKTYPIHTQLTSTVEGMRTLHTQVLPQPVEQQNGVNVPVVFHTLYTDMSGDYHTHTEKWEEPVSISIADNVRLETSLWPSGRPMATLISGCLQSQCDMELRTDAVLETGFPMVTGLVLGDVRPADPGRPSLILRRAGEKSLWQLAKESGSTVEDIRKTNQLEDEPEKDRMLLIPIK